jgi:hypothetical protein
MSQEEYIMILLTDCGFHTAAQRKAWLRSRFRREQIDELTYMERKLAIQFLKEIKETVNG